MIYLFFQPLKVKQQKFIEVPLLEMKVFTMYELDRQGLKTILFGSSSKRFSDRYTVKNINYTDNAKGFTVNMKADNGVYKNENMLLNGNVIYAREDGLRFHSDMARYNKMSGILSTDDDFIVYEGENSATGTSLKYNKFTKKMNATQIKAIYQLQESNK
jgi:LPS export ABC transporter protein LptC